jgi:hypothetical protein
MKEAYIIDGVRTPIGNYKGTLSAVRTDDLGALVIKELVNRNPNIPKEAFDDVILGCANQAGEDNRNVARMALLLAGLPFTVPGETVNRLCSSGLSAIIHANRAIKAGDGELFIAGGVENMTRGPYVMAKPSSAFGGDSKLYDSSFGWRFVNPKMDFGCAAYCQFADQCIGDLPEEFVAGQESLLKDKVAVEAKRFLKTDFKRIGKVTRIARYVEQISKEEGGNTPVLLCSAYIHEMAQASPGNEAVQSPTQLAKEVLTRIKASEPMIEAVCQMLLQPNDNSAPQGSDQAILHDSRNLSLLEESLKNSSDESVTECEKIREAVLTVSGKGLIGEIYEKMGVPQ